MDLRLAEMYRAQALNGENLADYVSNYGTRIKPGQNFLVRDGCGKRGWRIRQLHGQMVSQCGSRSPDPNLGAIANALRRSYILNTTH